MTRISDERILLYNAQRRRHAAGCKCVDCTAQDFAADLDDARIAIATLTAELAAAREALRVAIDTIDDTAAMPVAEAHMDRLRRALSGTPAPIKKVCGGCGQPVAADADGNAIEHTAAVQQIGPIRMTSDDATRCWSSGLPLFEVPREATTGAEYVSAGIEAAARMLLDEGESHAEQLVMRRLDADAIAGKVGK